MGVGWQARTYPHQGTQWSGQLTNTGPHKQGPQMAGALHRPAGAVLPRRVAPMPGEVVFKHAEPTCTPANLQLTRLVGALPGELVAKNRARRHPSKPAAHPARRRTARRGSGQRR